MNKARVFSGIRPSGQLHIGNYLGSIKQWVDLQKDYDCVFAVVDYHAITTPFEEKKLSENTLTLAKWIIASGVAPEKSPLILQSQLPEHTELAWILTCLTPLGELQRMTQYKEKKAQQTQVNTGLLTYPLLMAADILLYQTSIVPVGEDQKQHVELARNIAKKFNQKFGAVFSVPKVKLAEAPRVMSVKNPLKKMSKTGSDGIGLADSSAEITSKIMSAITDEKPGSQMSPGVKNLFVLLRAFAPTKETELQKKYQDKTLKYLELKQVLAEAIINQLKPIQQKFSQITDQEVLSIFENGKQKAQLQAQSTLDQVKKAIGIL